MKFTPQQCAFVYESLLENIYCLTLENGQTLDIRFKKEYFKHLLGLHKLTDIRQLSNMSARLVYKEILSGASLLESIRKSAKYSLILDRIDYFCFLPTLMHGKIIVNFDTRVVDGETHLHNTDLILYRKIGNGYVHLTIGENLDGYYPETFFYEPTKKYITGQTLLDVVKTEILFIE